MERQGLNELLNIRWTEQPSYDSAVKVGQCAYLFEWDDKVFYVGYSHHFGTRYLGGYRFLLEGCLLHGAKLYTGQLCGDMAILPSGRGLIRDVDEYMKQKLASVESLLIRRLRPPQNRRIPSYVSPLPLEHSGDVPACLRDWRN